MSRTRKEEEYTEKKKHIVLMAIELLDEIGYEQFSINKVIASAGMTKGAFFHYFDSKNELIEEILNLLQFPLAEVLKEIADDPALSPKQKILDMAGSIRKIRGEHQQTALQLGKLLQKEENKNIAYMATEKSIELFLPIYEKVLIEGNESGQFDIAYPNGSAFLYFNMLAAIKNEIGSVINDDGADEERRRKLREKIRAFEEYADSLFNLDEDIKIIDESFLGI